jgi:hypothetical protein
MEGSLSRTVLGMAMAAAVLASQVVPASADVLYDGGAPDQGGQIFSQSPNSAVAMSFTLASAGTATGVEWWGGCYPSTTCDPSPNFSITIWSDSSEGTPDSVIDFVPLTGVDQTATGNLIGGPNGWNEYAYSASIPGFSLAAGTTYWIVIQETSGESVGTWGWETTSSAPAEAKLESQDINNSCVPIDSTSWCSLPEQLAFQLDSSPVTTVAEPGSLSLCLAGLASFVVLRRRYRA